MLSPWFLEATVYSLAVFRLTMLLHSENGPFHVFDWLRFKAGITVDKNGKQILIKNSFFARLLTCPYCLSGWISLFAIVAILFHSDFVDMAAAWLAIWAVVYLLIGVIEK